MKKFFSLILFGFMFDANSQNNPQYPIIFPKGDKQCIKIKQPCTYNSESTCTMQYCGVSYSQYQIDNFSQKNSIIGKSFTSIFDIQDYLKSNIPVEFKHYSIRIISPDLYVENDYESHRITVLVKNLIIRKIIIN